MFVQEAYRQSPDYREFWAKLNSGEYQAAEYLRIGKGGKEVWIQASYNPIMDLNGKPFKVVKYATDVTQQVNTKNEVAAGAEREKLAAVELKQKVDSILKVVTAASEGDLTQEITVLGSDAVGLMGQGLSKLLGNLRTGFAAIGQNAQSLASASEELSSNSQQMSANAEETSAQAKVVSTQYCAGQPKPPDRGHWGGGDGRHASRKLPRMPPKRPRSQPPRSKSRKLPTPPCPNWVIPPPRLAR